MTLDGRLCLCAECHRECQVPRMRETKILYIYRPTQHRHLAPTMALSAQAETPMQGQLHHDLSIHSAITSRDNPVQRMWTRLKLPIQHLQHRQPYPPVSRCTAEHHDHRTVEYITCLIHNARSPAAAAAICQPRAARLRRLPGARTRGARLHQDIGAPDAMPPVKRPPPPASSVCCSRCSASPPI